MQAAAEAGISPPEFWKLTYRELDNHLKGYGKRLLEQWKIGRFGAYITYCANSKDPVPIDKFLPLEGTGEVKPRKRLMTKKQYEIMNKAWAN